MYFFFLIIEDSIPGKFKDEGKKKCRPVLPRKYKAIKCKVTAVRYRDYNIYICDALNRIYIERGESNIPARGFNKKIGGPPLAHGHT